MGNFFDDFDAEDFAFWAGFIETQLEGEQEEKIENEPEDITPDHLEKEGLIPDAGGDTDVDNYWDEEY